jgi:5S rRNA maturation endonuclease (ribonuclease M5)
MVKVSKPPDASNRAIRFEKAARVISQSILRNRPINKGGSNCPILVEGIKDERALKALGFSGIIEKLNRGFNRSKLIAYLYETYGTINEIDLKPPLIILMDWDRTGKDIQKFLRDRLMAMDIPIDEEMYTILLKVMKPESRTVESMLPYAEILHPLIEEFIQIS